MMDKTYPHDLPAMKPIPETIIPTPSQSTKGQRFPFSNWDAFGASARAAMAKSSPNTMLNAPNSRFSIGLCQNDESLTDSVGSKSRQTRAEDLLRLIKS